MGWTEKATLNELYERHREEVRDLQEDLMYAREELHLADKRLEAGARLQQELAEALDVQRQVTESAENRMGTAVRMLRELPPIWRDATEIRAVIKILKGNQ